MSKNVMNIKLDSTQTEVFIRDLLADHKVFSYTTFFNDLRIDTSKADKDKVRNGILMWLVGRVRGGMF